MSSKKCGSDKKTDLEQVRLWVRTALIIGFVFLVLKFSYLIIKPFLIPIVWGIIISVGIHPWHVRLSKFLGNRPKHSAALITLIGLTVLVVPFIFFTKSAVQSISQTVDAIEHDELNAPPPDSSVLEWPVVGDEVYELWSSSAVSLNSTIERYKPPDQGNDPQINQGSRQRDQGNIEFYRSSFNCRYTTALCQSGKGDSRYRVHYFIR